MNALDTPAVSDEPAYVFTAHDRCDGCGAQAYIRVMTMSGELLFCGHHSYEYRDALAKVAISIEGSTDHLAARLDVSA